jgi:uncharacterized protein (TIGR02266 family)
VLRLDLRLGDRAEWVRVFDPRDATVFIADDEPPPVGELVRIDLIAGLSGPRVILRGKVIARRVRGDSTLPRGFSVALGPDQREKVHYLNGFVRGGLLDLRERRRLPLRFPVTYGGVNGPVAAFTRDLNEEGLFVLTDDPLPEDTEVHLLLTVPVRRDPIVLVAQVSHTVVVEDEDLPGMGLRLLVDPARAAEFNRLIDELELLFLENQLAEEHLL